MTEQERWREVKRRRRAEDPEALREINRRWRANNPQSVKQSAKRTYAKAYAADPAAVNGRALKWQAANRGSRNATNARRYAAQLQRTPAWADHDQIRMVYGEAHARACHVDHVIPLKGKLVSGLHVHTNLQVLPGIENIRKGNRFQVEFQKDMRDPETAV